MSSPKENFLPWMWVALQGTWRRKCSWLEHHQCRVREGNNRKPGSCGLSREMRAGSVLGVGEGVMEASWSCAAFVCPICTEGMQLRGNLAANMYRCTTDLKALANF